ncbi:hypothetical protein Y1Q_0013062 [Alligator mississippiensis]|uniref:Uncharacterized protein n=1 Tax=Alligator mississippiensis TaxID=8496 RepID=A0A151NU42_ALLMI|nr:hypothetical protein Y1Q_0013062 [Alligator mississippiensis]
MWWVILFLDGCYIGYMFKLTNGSFSGEDMKQQLSNIFVIAQVCGLCLLLFIILCSCLKTHFPCNICGQGGGGRPPLGPPKPQAASKPGSDPLAPQPQLKATGGGQR